MLSQRLYRNRSKLIRLMHLLPAFIILAHSYEQYESGRNTYIFFGIAGIIFLTIVQFHPVIEKKAPWVDGLFFIIEGLLSLIVAIDFFSQGKKALPAAYLVAAAIQLFVAYVISKKRVQQHKSYH